MTKKQLFIFYWMLGWSAAIITLFLKKSISVQSLIFCYMIIALILLITFKLKKSMI